MSGDAQAAPPGGNGVGADTPVAVDPASTANWPVQFIPGDAIAPPRAGTGLCLSGGGSRAMVFHLGALLRLNEAGLLRGLSRVSGVSGGSITAGVLGMRWNELTFSPGDHPVATNLAELVVEPVEAFATQRIDLLAAVQGVVLPFVNAADRIEAAFNHGLYHDATLQDLPTDEQGPRFVFNATNLASGALWRFSRPYAWDWRVGRIPNPTFRLATAVAASAAFPPFFAPFELDVDPSQFEPGSGRDLELPEYQRKIPLADGGVYDNLGLETVFKTYATVLVSDGGGQLADDPTPPTDWARETLRMTGVIDHQVRSLRKRLLIAAYQRGDRSGTYWGIRQDAAEFGAAVRLACPFEATTELANLATRLDGMSASIRRRLVNWGYAVTDSSLRAWFDADLPDPAGFPYPGGVGGGGTRP